MKKFAFVFLLVNFEEKELFWASTPLDGFFKQELLFNNYIPYSFNVFPSDSTRFMRWRLVATFMNEQVQFGNNPKLSKDNNQSKHLLAK